MSQKTRSIKITIEDTENPDKKRYLQHSYRDYEYRDEYEDIIREINLSVDANLRDMLA